MTAIEEIFTEDSARAAQFMLWAGRLNSAAMNIQKAYSLAWGSTASEAPNARSSGSMNKMPTAHSAAPTNSEKITMVETVWLALSFSPAPSWRPASTDAPAAKMFSTDTMISSSGSVTPTAASAMSLFSIPM